MNAPSTLQLSCFNIALLIVLELALTAVAVFILFQLAEPMAKPTLALGLAQRYAVIEKEAPVSLPGFAAKLHVPPLFRDLPITLEPNHERARRLNRQLGLLLADCAAIGWLALWIARRQRPGAGWICTGLWFMAAMVFNPMGVPTWCYWLLTALCAAFYWLDGIIYRRSGRGQTRITTGVLNSYWFAFGWPGWVLLTGIGLLWVTDFAARGPVSHVIPYIGLYQADALWWSNIVLCLSALWRDRLLTGLAVAITRLSEFWRRKRGPMLLVPVGIALTLAVGWVGRPDLHVIFPGLAKPHQSGELLRAIFGIAAAWCLYRVGEWRAGKPRIRAALRRLALVLFMVLLGLGVAKDGGPALVISLALCLSVGTPLLHGLITRHARRGLFAIALLIVVVGCTWSFGLQEVAPGLSRRAAEREAAMIDPYRAASPYLAQIHWLMDAAPLWGFGLGRTPWCGAKAHVSAIPCTTGSGAPLQMPSDYATAGLAALWGLPGAAILLLVLMVWLVSLSWPGLAAWRSGRIPTWALLQSGLVVAFSLLALAQSLITAAGSFGLLPLTGITLPLLGYGGSALCFSAIWIGLALNPAGAVVAHRIGD